MFGLIYQANIAGLFKNPLDIIFEKKKTTTN